ncbi:MAG: VOC family protein [Motilibacteraceae bacterium]
MSHLEAITIHSRRPAVLAAFWSAVLALPVDPQDAQAIERGTLGECESVLLGRRDGPHVWISPAEQLSPPPGRVHLDIRLDDVADLDRLTSLGAVPQWQDPKGRWQVFADPEGNLFCALTTEELRPFQEHRCI